MDASASSSPDLRTSSLKVVDDESTMYIDHELRFDQMNEDTASYALYQQHALPRQTSSSSCSTHLINPPSNGSNRSETSCDSTEEDDMIYEFWETHGPQRHLHRIHLQSIGASTAGVYRAQALPNEDHTTETLFYGGKEFILKLYNIEAAEEIQSQVGIEFSDLSDDTIATYLEMKRDGRLQEYIDSLAEEVEASALPAQLQCLFEGEKINKAQIVRYALDAECHDRGVDVMAICTHARLVHEEQDTAVYRLAFAMFWITCARHKEFAVHLMFEHHVDKYHNLVPAMISFLKLKTETEFFDSMTTDAVAMELFQGATLLDLAESVDAGKVFGRMTNDSLRACFQDVLHLASCLLPLGLQQKDAAPRNVFVQFDQTSGYLTTSWIDLESVHPIQGDSESRHCLEQHVVTLLKEHRLYSAAHFQIPLKAMSSQLAAMHPDLRLESNLHMAFDLAIRDFRPEDQVRQFVQDCYVTSYDTHLYSLFSNDLLATSVYWSLVRSACKSFSNNPKLVTTYLQVLRHIMEHHLACRGAQCICWIRATYDSVTHLHYALGLQATVSWVSVCAEIVIPLLYFVDLVDRVRVSDYGELTLERYDELWCQMKDPSASPPQLASYTCERCRIDLVNGPELEQTVRLLFGDLTSSTSSITVFDFTTLRRLQNVENTPFVMDILMKTSGTIAQSSSLFGILKELPLSISSSRLLTLINSGTQHEHALDQWRAGVYLRLRA